MGRSVTSLWLALSLLAISLSGGQPQVYCTGTADRCQSESESDSCGQVAESGCCAREQGESTDWGCCVWVADQDEDGMLSSAVKVPELSASDGFQFVVTDREARWSPVEALSFQEWPDPPRLAGRGLLRRVSRCLI